MCDDGNVLWAPAMKLDVTNAASRSTDAKSTDWNSTLECRFVMKRRIVLCSHSSLNVGSETARCMRYPPLSLS